MAGPSGVPSWSTTPATNATADGGASNWAENQAPSTVNNSARQNLADIRALANNLVWFEYGSGDQASGSTYLGTPYVYASSTSVTVAGVDVTTAHHAGRRMKFVGVSTGTIYGTISSSSFSTNTTINLTFDSGSLSNETLTGYLSQVPVTGSPVPASAFSGTLGVANGGTGIASYAVGDILYASGATTLSKLADVATGNALISGGVTTAPSWGKIGLTTHVSGTLPVANGGTNASSASITAFNNITGYTASGATGTTSTNLVFSASPTLSGTVGGALTFSGALTLSSALTYGGVTLSNAVTGTGNMVLSASPTLSGTITLPGSSAISSGGLLGIGKSPSDPVDVLKSQDAGTFITLSNQSATTAAYLGLQLLSSGGTNSNGLFMFGGSFTTASLNRQDGVKLNSNGAGGLTLSTGAAQPIYIGVNNTQCAEWDANGNLLLGATTTGGRLVVTHDGSVLIGATWNNTNASAGADNEIVFSRNSSTVGSIQTTTTNTAYNTSSDARLKKNKAPSNDPGNIIDALKVRQFDWIKSSEHQDYGFVAQELHEVFPEAVTPTDDGISDGADFDPWQIDNSKLVPLLVAEIQGLRRRIASLEGELNVPHS